MAKEVKSQKSKVKSEKKDQKSTKLSELQDQVKALREELVTLHLDSEQKKLKNTSSLTLKRKELARLLTAVRQVQLTHEENV